MEHVLKITKLDSVCYTCTCVYDITERKEHNNVGGAFGSWKIQRLDRCAQVARNAKEGKGIVWMDHSRPYYGFQRSDASTDDGVGARKQQQRAKGRGEVEEGRLGRLCLSPGAQLRRHHGDRCLYSPQFEQCPALSWTASILLLLLFRFPLFFSFLRLFSLFFSFFSLLYGSNLPLFPRFPPLPLSPFVSFFSSCFASRPPFSTFPV